MILVTGGHGFLGKSLSEKIKSQKIKKNIFFTNKSKKFSIINKDINIDLLSEAHVKKLFFSKKFKSIIHLSVSRNPIDNPEIRSFDTLNSDIKILMNLLKYSKNVNKILFLSSAAVYKNVVYKKNKDNNVELNLVLKKIISFICNDTKKNKKLFSAYLLSNNKLVDKNIDPFFHRENNLRFNGLTKYISEAILKEYCREKNIELQILRPYRII